MHLSPHRPLSTPASSSGHTFPPSSYSTPKRPSHRYSDRFIPSRSASADLHAAFDMLRHSDPQSPSSPSAENTSAVSNVPSRNSQPSNSYSLLLKSQLLDSNHLSPSISQSITSSPSVSSASGLSLPSRPPSNRPSSLRYAPSVYPGLEGIKRLSSYSPASSNTSPIAPTTTSPNIFRFKDVVAPHSHPLSAIAAADSPFGLNVNQTTNALLSASVSPARASRKISRTPFKVLDAPCLKDDFYLNLVDWSSQNVLAVGLGTCVYLWSACTSVVTKLCDLHFGGPVCSVAWNQQGNLLAVGTRLGNVQIWDATTCNLIRTLAGHTARAGCLAWNSSLLSSGGRDKEIFNRDLRCKEQYIAQLSGHKQEVCGLRWSFDDMQLASGGNDNKLLIWNGAGLGSGGSNVQTGSTAAYNSPVLRFSYHDAAVKAIAWSPHARGLLASGGGTADRKIRFWNTMTNSALAAVDTGSQVCNLAWSKNVNEIVSTHGYSQNQIIVWKYPTLSKVATLMGHCYRVLYLAVSPSGESIVTGAGDETLRFWNVFPGPKSRGVGSYKSSKLSPGRMNIR